jgi:hypothetical protein
MKMVVGYLQLNDIVQINTVAKALTDLRIGDKTSIALRKAEGVVPIIATAVPDNRTIHLNNAVIGA